jgi:hypothetical protein
VKVLIPGKHRWSVKRICFNIDCQAELEVEDRDLFWGVIPSDDTTGRLRCNMGISFKCPECGTPNVLPQDLLTKIPSAVYTKALSNEQEI